MIGGDGGRKLNETSTLALLDEIGGKGGNERLRHDLTY